MPPDQIYPDTAAGAISALQDMSTFDCASAQASSDPYVRGVWLVKLASGTRAIVYLAGYPTPFGIIRSNNDFESEESHVHH